jgi:positive regulator of sigma E activity
LTETARILSIDGTTATLSCSDNQTCESCNGLFCNVKARTYKAIVPDTLEVSPGDRVEVFVPPAKAIAAGFWVLVAPLILFLAGYFALSSLDSEPLQVAGGVVGLAIGFVIVALRTRRRPPELPSIVSVQSAHDAS